MSHNEQIVISLISHTNIGKTSLARTLLRRDVGEVRDGTHVTQESRRFTMIRSQRAELLIWDTPGFGNVTKLLSRFQSEGRVWTWLQTEVVDRVFNKPLYCSIEAARNVREEADIVLYLVNTGEAPQDAGYVKQELRLLEALAKPVLMVLNQVNASIMADQQRQKQLIHQWREHYRGFDCVKDVIILDAFRRGSRHERGLLEKLRPWLEEPKKQALDELIIRFEEQQKQQFRKAAEAAADVFIYACRQENMATEKKEAETVFKRMVYDLQSKLDAYLDLLIQLHGLEAGGRAGLQAHISQVSGMLVENISEQKAGLLAGALSMAGTGLAADILAGGLTFGGGALLGFLGGYLGGRGFAKFANFFSKGQMTWKDEALKALFKLLVAYYMLAAHHGRGRGALLLDNPKEFFSDTFENQVWPGVESEIEELVTLCRQTGERTHNQSQAAFTDKFAATIHKADEKLYA